MQKLIGGHLMCTMYLSTCGGTPNPPHRNEGPEGALTMRKGFTLIELLVVIAIM